MYRRGRSTKEAYRHGSTSSLPFPTSIPVNGFGQVSEPEMLHHLFTSYGAIDKIDLKENAVTMMGSYHPAETLNRSI